MSKIKIVILCVLGVVAITLLLMLTRGHPKQDLISRAGPGTPLQIGVSPDGKWILQWAGKGDHFPRQPIARAQNGSRTVKWPYDNYGDNGCWLPDSRHWASLEVGSAGTILLMFSLDNPQITRIPLSLPMASSYLLGVTPQGHALFANDRPETHSRFGSDTLTVVDANITTHLPTMRTFSIKKPDQENGDWGQVSLAPQGDRLAWVYFSNRPSSIGSWVSLWTKHSYVGGRETLDLWVSRLDGSPPRYVGEVNGQQLSFGAWWTPDGKSLSLTVDGASYAVPVG